MLLTNSTFSGSSPLCLSFCRIVVLSHPPGTWMNCHFFVHNKTACFHCILWKTRKDSCKQRRKSSTVEQSSVSHFVLMCPLRLHITIPQTTDLFHTNWDREETARQWLTQVSDENQSARATEGIPELRPGLLLGLPRVPRHQQCAPGKDKKHNSRTKAMRLLPEVLLAGLTRKNIWRQNYEFLSLFSQKHSHGIQSCSRKRAQRQTVTSGQSSVDYFCFSFVLFSGTHILWLVEL